MKILSWNVNGVRAVQKKGFLEWLEKESPDILGLQETKAHPDQLDVTLLHPKGYHTFWNMGIRKGYSGVAVYTKQKPLSISTGFEISRFDSEGRVIVAEYPDFFFLNIYFPNGKKNDERLQYKMDFYEATGQFVGKLKVKGKPVITSGDYNTAHKPIDLARPEANQGISGFLPIERAWMDRWVESGQIDIFREFYPDPHKYSWWDMKSGARQRNVGWRIDYHFITPNLKKAVADALILHTVMGSDHCPVSLILK